MDYSKDKHLGKYIQAPPAPVIFNRPGVKNRLARLTLQGMYAIVDIETTGGYAASHDITEIAIVLHDGQRVTERFETLVRPSVPIPYFIQSLTGITPDMVADAPLFTDVAPRIFRMLEGRVFVAHNVNFDFSFLKYHLLLSGFELAVPKLCTVRLSRKVFPALPSYSLGNLCRHFNIDIRNRHRAGGDALATAALFDLLVTNDAGGHIEKALKRGSGEQYLPPHLPREQVENLPYSPGVYYFHDNKGKIIYVGKAKNISYRVKSHFTQNGAGRQRQRFIQHIHSISYQCCGNELMAFILENIEIRKHWPRFNSSQKSFTPSFGLYTYEDRHGYLRMGIEKKKTYLKAHYTFNLLAEGQRLLRQLADQFALSPALCNLPDLSSCPTTDPGYPEEYNSRVNKAIRFLEKQLPTFAVVDQCFDPAQRSCILIEKGRFYGMGYVPAELTVRSAEELKTYLQAYPENDYIRGLVYQYARQSPDKKLVFEESLKKGVS